MKNYVELEGNILKETTVFTLKQSGKRGATVHVQTAEKIIDSEGNEREIMTFHDVVTFDESIVKKVEKYKVGDPVSLTGNIIKRHRKVGKIYKILIPQVQIKTIK